MELEFLDGSAKVILAGQPETMHGPGAILTKVDFVEIGLQDLFFRIAGIQDDRHHDFVDLAPPGPLRGQVKILDQLLRQRAASLDDAPSTDVDKDGPHNAAQRDAVMIIKIMVLAGKQGVQEIIGGLIQFDQHAILPASRIETADLCRLHPQEGHGFTGGHVFQQDDLILRELCAQLAGRFRLVRELKIPGLEDHLIAQPYVAPLGRKLGILSVFELIQQPLEAACIVRCTHEDLC